MNPRDGKNGTVSAVEWERRLLGISVAAVKLRLHGTFKRLNIRSRSQLAAMLR